MTKLTRWLVPAAVACALIAVGAATVGAKSKGKSTNGTIYIGSNPRSGVGLLYVAGDVVDKVLGEGAITFTIRPIPNTSGTITAKALKVTLWTTDGSLTGTGSALLTITNMPKTGDSTVSNGTVSLTKGTGAQKGHSFKATFTGSGNLTGAFYTFNYKGTYK
jgi:hypothetical protein